VTKFPRTRILRTIIRGCKRLTRDGGFPTRRQLQMMARHRAVTAYVLQNIGPIEARERRR
jgi:hypothetical protein